MAEASVNPYHVYTMLRSSFGLAIAAVALGAGPSARPASPLPSTTVDSFTVVVSNRVVLDIKAPAATVWSFLPSIRKRPLTERIALNGALDQLGSRFDVVTKDSSGKVTRHDRLEVLHWEPTVRYAAHVTYMPPADPITIVYNVDLKESAGVTHLVMDAYATVRLPDPGTDQGRLAAYVKEVQTSQEQTSAAYQGLKAQMEAAAKQ